MPPRLATSTCWKGQLDQEDLPRGGIQGGVRRQRDSLPTGLYNALLDTASEYIADTLDVVDT